MSWNQRLEILSSNVWGKVTESSTVLPKDSVALCAYQLLVQGIADMDQIAYIHSTPSQDELWMVTEEVLFDTSKEAIVNESPGLDTLFQGQSMQAMRVLTMNHTDSIFSSGMFLLSEYFDAVCGFYSPVKFLAEGLLLRHDYEEISERQKDTIRKNQATARKRETKIIKVATQLGLHPQPPLLNPEIWSAQCPGTGHQLYINARKNEFGCGYCCRKGGPEALREFVALRKGE
ncbi:MAG: hypothetical protein HOD11_09445 [Candidatus Marinimicrobia bacterium]|jgi:hypothetical protein|nr:hypothetical protein [Candidatus Neomarinimicrobiota bacterium]